MTIHLQMLIDLIYRLRMPVEHTVISLKVASFKCDSSKVEINKDSMREGSKVATQCLKRREYLRKSYFSSFNPKLLELPTWEGLYNKCG